MITLWLACLGPAEEPLPDDPSVELRVFIDGKATSGGGTLVVQAEYDPAGDLELPTPTATPELTFTEDGRPTEEQVGARRVITQRYLFRGPSGSYEIPPLTATWQEGEAQAQATSTAVFVDLDVPPPRAAEIADIVEPSAIFSRPWLALGALVALFALGFVVAFRPRRAPAPVLALPVPPDRAALTEWERVRDDPQLTIDDKAQHIARIFRVYVEAVLGFEATSRTTYELLAHLDGLRHLPQGNVPRARRVLRAADRVKFAEQRPADAIATWLSELDADLRGFVESTRPSAWTGEPPARGAAP